MVRKQLEQTESIHVNRLLEIISGFKGLLYNMDEK